VSCSSGSPDSDPRHPSCSFRFTSSHVCSLYQARFSPSAPASCSAWSGCSIYVSVAATLGATLAFLIGRYFARQWVAARLANYPKFKAVDEAAAREGWKIVALTRLSPVFPFNLLNYAFGLTNVGVRDYVLASWAGTLPGTILYVYLGSLAGDLSRVATGGTQRSAAEWALYAIGLLATIAVTVYVTRICNRALKAVS
jgi:uncharacterized membrane protein YdjX (TVP38/TMEM64 family)